MAVQFTLADGFRLWLETTPQWVRGKGGQRGEMARTGKPYSDASRANALPAASSFFGFLDKISDDGVKNPFDAVQRPYLDPDYFSTPGYTEQEWAKLLVTARDEHRIAGYRKRTYAMLLVLYTCCLRIDALLNARVEDLVYDKGHRVLLVRVKGGGRGKKPIPPATWDALQGYLDGRTEGWLFCTSSGGKLDEPAVWRTLQSLAKRANLPLRGPHGKGRCHHTRPGEARCPSGQGAALGRPQGLAHDPALQLTEGTARRQPSVTASPLISPTPWRATPTESPPGVNCV
ncbi:tyrosine-type recombinase/integrase [Streptomyces xanthophaeus]